MSRWALVFALVLQGTTLAAQEGSRVFQRCVPCHTGNGGGVVGTYPPLVAHAPEVLTSSRSYLITVLLYGLRGKIEVKGQKKGYDGVMPNHYELNDEEAAAVLNYVLTSWGNEKLLPADFKPITAAEIKAERGRDLTPHQVYEARKVLASAK